MVNRSRDDTLAVECQVFCRYLINQDAASDVTAAYLRAHESGSVEAGPSLTPFDRALLRLARTGPGLARAADGYAAAFARLSLLRRKLVLLVAILERRGSSAAALDTAVPGSRLAWVLELGVRVVGFGLMLGLATLLLAPLRIWYRVVPGPSSLVLSPDKGSSDQARRDQGPRTKNQGR